MYDAIDDPYTYENSTVLVNKLDLRDQDELDAYEAEISSARSGEPLPEGEFDFEHYCAVHHHLFQDVYTCGQAPHGAHVEAGQPVLLSRAYRYPGHEAVRGAKGG